MVIKDSKGMYQIELEGNVVYEQLKGLYNEDDMNRLHNEYITKLAPKLKGKNWTKCSDLREYRASNINNSASKHMEWCQSNGMMPGAILIESAVVKMQMNRVSKENQLAPTAFTELNEAKEWLKSKGY